MQDKNAVRGEWRLARVSKCYPDGRGRVRNVELLVKPRQGSSGGYIPSAPILLRRHVKNLILLVPSDEPSYSSDVTKDELPAPTN